MVINYILYINKGYPKEHTMSKKNLKQQTIAHIKKQRGLDRQHFLETNGDMKQWHPPRIVMQDKKKSRNKRACRGKWDA